MREGNRSDFAFYLHANFMALDWRQVVWAKVSPRSDMLAGFVDLAPLGQAGWRRRRVGQEVTEDVRQTAHRHKRLAGPCKGLQTIRGAHGT